MIPLVKTRTASQPDFVRSSRTFTFNECEKKLNCPDPRVGILHPTLKTEPSARIPCLGSQRRRFAMRAPPGVKDDESGAKSTRPGERLPYSCCSAKGSADTMREFPA